MREIEAIIHAYDQAKATATECALATVVHVEGSSYRRAGARMLVDENGFMTGAISGGCLEGDALRKALLAIHQGRNKLVTYDTSDEDDAIIGAQLGCNGVIQVLFEPLDFKQDHNPLELLRQAHQSQEAAALVSLFCLKRHQHQPGTSMLWMGEKSAIGTLENTDMAPQLEAEVQLALSNQTSHFCLFQSETVEMQAFIEVLPPPFTLVMVGAGNDARILAQMAEPLGWSLIVADGRPSHANEDRFASSCQVVVTKPEEILANIPLNERTAFVLITHNYHYDLAVFRLLLDKPDLPYIGILGPRKKYERMLTDLSAEGIQLTENQASRVYAPIGLSIGAESPAEIALSILAEIQSVMTRSDATPLRDRPGPIHDKKNYYFKEVSF